MPKSRGGKAARLARSRPLHSMSISTFGRFQRSKFEAKSDAVAMKRPVSNEATGRLDNSSRSTQHQQNGVTHLLMREIRTSMTCADRDNQNGQRGWIPIEWVVRWRRL